jgi:SulP family sulfate permease
LDATGLHALELLAGRLRKSGRTLLLCGARDQPLSMLESGDFLDHIGRDNLCLHVESALERARQIYAAFGGVGSEMAEDFSRSSM